MSKPIVAVVGRPNVGKSTLFNSLCGQQISIVKDTPGVTRDRIYADVSWLDYNFTMIDTGGIEPDSGDIILSQMREQAQIAIDTAELSALNALVHPAVMEDFERWCGRQSGADYVVLESAILFEAGLEGYVDRTIAVTAPIDVRIARTCLRDGASAEEVRRRIAVQLDEEELRRRADYTLVNINLGELEYEVARLDKLLRDENRKHSA